ncbi:type II secretion system protein [Candidatus Saccharibacteria bacterium]|nr:type II secretion system protein [Candidatus Saccharibacteria bacterium]
MNKHGFTLLETVISLAFAGLLITLFFVQKSNLDAFTRDETRKTAINAMYFALEQDFYKTHGYYPESISSATLPTVTPSLWTDPSGFSFGAPESSYHYTPANCVNGKCREYRLTATLEKESLFTRSNSH